LLGGLAFQHLHAGPNNDLLADLGTDLLDVDQKRRLDLGDDRRIDAADLQPEGRGRHLDLDAGSLDLVATLDPQDDELGLGRRREGMGHHEKREGAGNGDIGARDLELGSERQILQVEAIEERALVETLPADALLGAGGAAVLLVLGRDIDADVEVAARSKDERAGGLDGCGDLQVAVLGLERRELARADLHLGADLDLAAAARASSLCSGGGPKVQCPEQRHDTLYLNLDRA